MPKFYKLPQTSWTQHLWLSSPLTAHTETSVSPGRVLLHSPKGLTVKLQFSALVARRCVIDLMRWILEGMVKDGGWLILKEVPVELLKPREGSYLVILWSFSGTSWLPDPQSSLTLVIISRVLLSTWCLWTVDLEDHSRNDPSLQDRPGINVECCLDMPSMSWDVFGLNTSLQIWDWIYRDITCIFDLRTFFAVHWITGSNSGPHRWRSRSLVRHQPCMHKTQNHWIAWSK